jgi:hypothetical protein
VASVVRLHQRFGTHGLVWIALGSQFVDVGGAVVVAVGPLSFERAQRAVEAPFLVGHETPFAHRLAKRRRDRSPLRRAVVAKRTRGRFGERELGGDSVWKIRRSFGPTRMHQRGAHEREWKDREA